VSEPEFEPVDVPGAAAVLGISTDDVLTLMAAGVLTPIPKP